MMENATINKIISKRISSLATIAEELPGAVIVHWVKDGTVEYISPKAERQLGVRLAEIKEIGLDYYSRFFNAEDAAYYLLKILDLIKRNNIQEYVIFFQQVKVAPSFEWVWHLSSTKIFMQDEEGTPLYL